MRTVGCCSHIACIIYYFAHGQSLNKIPQLGSKLVSIFSVSEIKIDSDSDCYSGERLIKTNNKNKLACNKNKKNQKGKKKAKNESESEGGLKFRVSC